MMSQNRQQDIDRKQAENDYQINIKAELEIELLHRKIDEFREKEIPGSGSGHHRSDRAYEAGPTIPLDPLRELCRKPTRFLKA